MAIDDVFRCSSCAPLMIRYEKADQIPPVLRELAKRLRYSTPYFRGDGSARKLCNVIPLLEYADARIHDIFSRQAREMLGDQNGWYISEVNYNRLFDENNHCIKSGITFWPSEGHNKASIETLEATYNEILATIRSGWVRKDDSDSNCEFDHFIKVKSFLNEDTLLRCIAKKLSLNEHVLVDEIEGGDTLRLEIRKSAFDKVVEKMGFNIV